jgi:hypothetical protein
VSADPAIHNFCNRHCPGSAHACVWVNDATATQAAAYSGSQARLLDATDILVTGHGAVIATFVFLPRCSVVVDLSSEASHRWMNVHAAKTLKPLQLQTVSVSGRTPSSPLVYRDVHAQPRACSGLYGPHTGLMKHVQLRLHLGHTAGQAGQAAGSKSESGRAIG